MGICKYCNDEFVNTLIGAHVKWCSLNPNRNKYIEHAKSLNKSISKESRKKQGESLSKTHKDQLSKGINKHKNWTFNGKHHSDKTKLLMSVSRKKWISENRENFNWNVKKKISVPCEIFKDKLRRMNLSFIDEYSPFEKRFFCIDVAFPERMLAVEINGNQHYNIDGTLKQYYKERHDFIESNGWKVYEIHFSKVYSDDIESIINDILNKNEVISEFDYEFWISHPRRKSERITEEKKRKEENKKEKLKELIQTVIDSDIDFSKFGWVEKVSKLLNKRSQKMSAWMKKNMPDFYEEKCFKRKKQHGPIA